MLNQNCNLLEFNIFKDEQIIVKKVLNMKNRTIVKIRKSSKNLS